MKTFVKLTLVVTCLSLTAASLALLGCGEWQMSTSLSLMATSLVWWL